MIFSIFPLRNQERDPLIDEKAAAVARAAAGNGNGAPARDTVVTVGRNGGNNVSMAWSRHKPKKVPKKWV